MKKGFTLVELLATIVILAIVSLITIPVITGVINKTRLNSLKSSAYGLLEASNLYVAQYETNKTIRFDIDNNNITSNDTINLLKYKGTVKEGTVILNKNGKVTVCITDGNNSAYKNYNENKITLVEKNKCYIPDNTSIVYLDNGATITELSNQELTDRLNEALNKISELENMNIHLNEKINNSLSNINTNITQQINQINNKIYPVGSIYMSMNNTNPSTLFGGTWEQIESGKMLQSTTTNSGVEGGSKTHTHTLNSGYADIILTGNYAFENYVVVPSRPMSLQWSISDQQNSSVSTPYAVKLGGTTDSSSNMPPYITVYMWKRIS